MNKKPRILFIATFPPPVHGSAVVSQYIKDSELIKSEFDMDFVNISTSRQMSEIGKTSPVLLLKKLCRFLGSYLRCFGLLLTHRYALCYCAITCHGVGFLKDSPFVLLCRLFGHKIVIHQHNKGMSGDLDKWPYCWYTPFVYKNCKVILLSWRLYPDIEKVVKREDVMICPNGIPPIEGLEVRGERLENKIPKLLYLSNLIVSKGVYVLLDACKILKDKGIAFTCDFVGGESKEISREIFEAAVHERGLDEKVQYLGCKYGNEKVSEYRNSDAFVLPTMDDCLPLTIVEAMQQAIPTVSTDIGAVADLVQPMITGLIAATNSPEDLAEKLQLLIENKDLRLQLGRNALSAYNEKFSLEAFEKCLLSNLKDLMGGGKLEQVWLQVHGSTDVPFVRYQGPKYGDDKETFWNNADLFVFPTFYENETFGLVNLEAMQHEIPVVSTDEGGIPDVVRNMVTGLIAKSQSPENLAEKLETLINDRDLRIRLGKKGLDIYKENYTIEAFERCLLKCLNSIMGGGNLMNVWSRIHDVLDTPFVQYHGPKYGVEKEKFWNDADLFVFPTFNEAFGLVAVEAMQHSLPVVATDEGGICDIIADEKTGYVVPKQDSNALAEKLEILISDRNICHQFGKAGYERYVQKFTLNRFEQKMLGCLKDSM